MSKLGGWQKAVKLVLVLLLVVVGFFCWQKQESKATSINIVINEIMVGKDTQSKFEFIELYNNSNEDIDLSGYGLKKKTQSGTESNLVSQTKFIGIIPKKGYFLIAHPDYQDELNADLVYSGTSYSIAMNNTVLLYDINGGLVDKVGFGEAGDYESAPAPEFANGQGIERKEPGADTDNNSSDFIINNNPSPGEKRNEVECGNGIKEIGEDCDDGNISDGDGCGPSCLIEEETGQSDDTGSNEIIADSNPRPLIKKWEVVINELVVDPSDGDVEWIEIYNTISRAVDISDWTVEEGSGAATTLDGELSSIGSGKYYTIEKPKGNLNNSGDIIILRDENGAFIDQVVYGDWDDGNINDNAPTASDPRSIARKNDGVSSGNNFSDFVVTETLTKGKENIISNSSGAGEEITTFDFSADVIISEIFPNPIGDDSLLEFVEIYNQGNKIVNLGAWQLGDNSQKRYSMAGQIDPREYLVIYRKASGLALNNTSETVKLFQPGEEEAYQEINYDKAKEGMSLNCLMENLGKAEPCIWSTVVTPGKTNKIIIPNNAPKVEIICPDEVIINMQFICDASDSFDMDSDELSYFWDFGDGQISNKATQEYSYAEVKRYTIILEVFDGQASTTVEHKINVDGEVVVEGLDMEINDEENYGGIVINEFLPNPIGSDVDGEWIEIKNNSESAINIMNWQIDDELGGSKPFKIIAETWLMANEYLAINREDSDIALNNSGDKVRLLAPNGEVADEIEYSQVYEGASYALSSDGNWFWTTKTTKGEENEIETIASQDTKKVLDNNASDRTNEVYLNISLSDIRDCDIGDKVRASGTVAVLPGILGAQYFYIIASSGVQIYNYKKDFPELEIGDLVEVQGEFSQSQGEARIKTKEINDIQIVGHRDLNEPAIISCVSIEDNMIGSLIKIEGEVLEKQGSYLYLADDSGEAQIYIKKATNISLSNLAAGDKISAMGIVNKTQSGLRLLPRGIEDIVKLAKQTNPEGKVLGEVETRDVWSIPQRDKKRELLKYIIGISLSLVVVFSVLLIRIFVLERGGKRE